MSQLDQDELHPQRVHVGAFVDREQRDALAARARVEGRSVSSVLRLAAADYLAKPTTDEILARANEVLARPRFKPIEPRYPGEDE